MADSIQTEKTVITKTESFIKNMSIWLGGIIIVVLIIIKVNVPEFKIWALLLAIAGVAIFFIGVYYFVNRANISSMEKEQNNKIPKPITIEEAREIAKQTLRNPNYAEYAIKLEGEDVQQRGKSVKNDIYISEWKGYYSNEPIFVLINMNYPKLRRSVKLNPKQIELEQAKMYLANEESVVMKEIKIANPTLGIEQTILEPQKDKEEKKEEDKDL